MSSSDETQAIVAPERRGDATRPFECTIDIVGDAVVAAFALRSSTNSRYCAEKVPRSHWSTLIWIIANRSTIIVVKLRDYLLRGLARQFEECSRERDAIARHGGDEFAVLSHQSEGNPVGPRVERPAADTAGIGVAVNLSTGVPTCDAALPSAEACPREADRVMHRVKHAPRDDVVHGRFGDDNG